MSDQNESPKEPKARVTNPITSAEAVTKNQKPVNSDKGNNGTGKEKQ